MTAKKHEDLKVRAFPSDIRRPRRTPGAWVLLLGGFSMCILGLVVTIVANTDIDAPVIVSIVERLELYEITRGGLILGGMLLLAVGMVARYVGLHAATILAPGQVEHALSEVGADMAEFSNRIQDFQNDHIHFRTEIEMLRKDLMGLRQHEESDEKNDKIFQLAAGVDQLHARIDQRLGEVASNLHDAIGDLSRIVEASRDFLQESIEEQSERTQGLRSQLTHVANNVKTLAHALEEYDVPAAAPGLEHYGVADAFGEAGVGDGLDVLVDLEQPGAAGAELAGDEGLGLLDELDDEFEAEVAISEPAPSEADPPPAQEAAPSSPPSAPEGVGPLPKPSMAPPPALPGSDQASPIEGQEEPTVIDLDQAPIASPQPEDK